MAKSDPAARREAASTPAPRYRIAAVDRALDVIEALARIGPAPLARLAEEAGCTRTAAFRLLRTLQAREFAIQEDGGAWRLGLRWAMTHAAPDAAALAAAARPHLSRLAAAVGENVLLRVRLDLASVTVARRQASPDLPTGQEPDERGPLHAGSGRLLLAYAPEAVRKAALARKLPRLAANTRTDAAWVGADLPRIRARGWLIAAGEVTEASIVIAAPVRDARGDVAAALVIAASDLRLSAARARALVPVLLAAAAALSRALGTP